MVSYHRHQFFPVRRSRSTVPRATTQTWDVEWTERSRPGRTLDGFAFEVKLEKPLVHWEDLYLEKVVWRFLKMVESFFTSLFCRRQFGNAKQACFDMFCISSNLADLCWGCSCFTDTWNGHLKASSSAVLRKACVATICKHVIHSYPFVYVHTLSYMLIYDHKWPYQT